MLSPILELHAAMFFHDARESNSPADNTRNMLAAGLREQSTVTKKEAGDGTPPGLPVMLVRAPRTHGDFDTHGAVAIRLVDIHTEVIC